MKAVLKLAAAAEAATGVILVGFPPIVVSLLFGVGVAGFAEVVSRFAGIALIGLGLSCWPGAAGRSPLNGMLVYGTLAALYLAVVDPQQVQVVVLHICDPRPVRPKRGRRLGAPALCQGR